MAKQKKSMGFKIIITLGILGVLAASCLVVGGIGYYYLNHRAVENRPLVLFQNPLNHEELTVGESVLIQATARETNGLSKIELWVDDKLVASKVSPSSSTTTLMITSDWVPTIEGAHIFVVKAVSQNGIEGQASVNVHAAIDMARENNTHIVAEGEDLAGIAEDYGTTPEELSELNPEIPSGGVSAGDELTLPDDEPPAGGSGSPPAGDGSPADEEPAEGAEPPSPESPPPSGSGWFTGTFYLGPVLHVFESIPAFDTPGEEIGLRVEIVQLSSSGGFEGLHCYIGMGENPPRWFPDMDNDQATDESFASMDSTDDNTNWDVGDAFSGNDDAVVFWRAGEDLPIDVSCVGIGGGGTEAYDLGRWAGAVPTDNWDGGLNTRSASGPDGSFTFSYRISRMEEGDNGHALYLDTDMTSPTNVHLDERRTALAWDYLPAEDEEPIDGFRIYLNGSLQWVENADARESFIPYEWFNPPCGTTYTFGVSVFRNGIPDGPESLPGVAILAQDDVACTREIQITFLTLETFDLGGDGRRPHHDGDVGPVYGSFFANEQSITFDTRSPGSGGSLDYPAGLNHNTVYDLPAMSADRQYHYSGLPAMIVDVPEGGSFDFGFMITDQDHGSCRHAGDPGCDDEICSGLSFIITDENEFNYWHDGTLTSENGRCRVTYRWGPAFDSPVGSGVPGWEPLPWINVEDIHINDDTGQVQVEVRNTGSATWPWRDLTIALQTRDGDLYGNYTFPGFVIEPGETKMLENPEMHVGEPYDVCVVIDPNNEVIEEYERSGSLAHGPVCPPVPDLKIDNVTYDPRGGGMIKVIVKNIGTHPLSSRSVALGTTLPDGTSLYLGRSWPNISMGRNDSHLFTLSGVSESMREQMQQGYVVTVNPEGSIIESNMDNNDYQVPAMDSLRVRLMTIVAPWDYRNSAEFDFKIYAVSGDNRRQIAHWNLDNVDWGSCSDSFSAGCILASSPDSLVDQDTYWFDIYGDEILEIVAKGSHRGGFRHTVVLTFLPENNWDSNDWGPRHSCSSWANAHHRGYTYETHDTQDFGFSLQVCHEGP